MCYDTKRGEPWHHVICLAGVQIIVLRSAAYVRKIIKHIIVAERRIIVRTDAAMKKWVLPPSGLLDGNADRAKILTLCK